MPFLSKENRYCRVISVIVTIVELQFDNHIFCQIFVPSPLCSFFNCTIQTCRMFYPFAFTLFSLLLVPFSYPLDTFEIAIYSCFSGFLGISFFLSLSFSIAFSSLFLFRVHQLVVILNHRCIPNFLSLLPSLSK